MNKEGLIKLKESISKLKPDIQQNQEMNKEAVYKEYLNVFSVDRKTSDLTDLLFMKSHYFDTGFYCKYTPEELNLEIDKEIQKQIEVQLEADVK